MNAAGVGMRDFRAANPVLLSFILRWYCNNKTLQLASFNTMLLLPFRMLRKIKLQWKHFSFKNFFILFTFHVSGSHYIQISTHYPQNRSCWFLKINEDWAQYFHICIYLSVVQKQLCSPSSDWWNLTSFYYEPKSFQKHSF